MMAAAAVAMVLAAVVVDDKKTAEVAVAYMDFLSFKWRQEYIGAPCYK
jgi:ABC-type sulfate transport system substrate-binding protein